jgi:sugar phosphate isomerase/epimerase
MRRTILNCISTIDELDVAAYNRLGVGVEIQDFTEPNLSEPEIKDLVLRYKRLFRDLEQPKALHGPFLDLKPSSPDPMIRTISQNRYLKALQIATDLEADYIVFHSQINPQLTEPFLSNLNNRQSRDAWHEIIGQVPDYCGTVVIENVFESTPAMLRALIETISLPNIKVNLDIGHSKLSTASLEDWIRELQDHIAYIHLHSNNGIHDQHVKAPQGEIDYLYRLLDRYAINPVLALEYPIQDLDEEIRAIIGD